MLTLVSCQVNCIAMVDVQRHQYTRSSAQQSLTAGLLQPLLQKRRPQRMLVLKHALAGELQFEAKNPLQTIVLSGDMKAEKAEVHARLSALPFEDKTFEVVVLQNLVSDGSEAVLSETLRVLAPAGDIIISGINSAGLLFRLFNRADDFPGLKTNRIIDHLKSQSFNIEHCLCMGLANQSWPGAKEFQHGLTLPFADRVAIHAHDQSSANGASILRFKRARPQRVASAALDGISNRASSA
jgi:SAM-dependent methyltransferase